ncbi:aminotransferase [Cladorrhinum sp. PSN259]|nr:aminotransferase [Cladorrhinum sp. PSN259]
MSAPPPDFQIFTTLRYDPLLLTLPTHNPPLTHAGYNHTTQSPFYMLPYHRDRLLASAKHFNFSQKAIDLLTSPSALQTLSQTITSQIPDHHPSSPPHRVRVAISPDGTISVTASEIPPVPLSNLFPSSLPSSPGPTTTTNPSINPDDIFQVLVDTNSRTNPSEYTHYKTTSRKSYDSARERAGIVNPADKKEVLIVDESSQEVMEASITTPYFFRESKWVTPLVREQHQRQEQQQTPEKYQGGQDGTSRRWALETGIATEAKILVNSLVDGEQCWLSNGARGFFPGVIRLA